MPLWLIPMVYTLASLVAGLILPRFEQTYFAAYTNGMSAGAALAFFSAVSSGMMALTGIVFAIAFVMVQFSALAYSPRLVAMFASSPTLYHALGVFFATFIYALAALIWTDRGGSGAVPLLSYLLVTALLVASLLVFVWLIRSVNDLQIHNVLQVIGSRGRAVIRGMFPHTVSYSEAETPTAIGVPAEFGPVTQTLSYTGDPMVIARFDIAAIVRLAQRANVVVSFECGVGETLVEDAVLLRVRGSAQNLPEERLRRAVRLATTRTHEQDPKYAIRLLVDIAIRALSPAINDPTTAVQALDQIEDLLRRLGRRQLDAGYARDRTGTICVTFPVPTWQDYLSLSFDEIRQFGATSVQVVRRLRSALVGLADTVAGQERRDEVLRYLDHLNRGVGRSGFDDQDQAAALLQDRQGLGLSREQNKTTEAPAVPKEPAQQSTLP